MTKLHRDEKKPAADRYPVPVEQEIPPAYALNPPDLVAAFSNLDLKTAESVPTKDQCIAHLKLLEAFHQLREDVATTDGLFGISDSLVSDEADEQLRGKVLLKIREKRWAVYVAKAVSRFEKWIEMYAEPQGLMLRQAEMDKGFPTIVQGQGKVTFTKDTLPPIGKLIFELRFR